MRERSAAPHSLTMILLGGLCGSSILLLPGHSAARILPGLLLALVLPGWALSDLLPIAGGRRNGFIVPGLSVAAVILDSLAMNAVGVPLGARAWSISLSLLTVVAATAGLLNPPGVKASRAAIRLRGRALAIALPGLGAVLLLTAATFLTIYSVRDADGDEHFTQLWVVPSSVNPNAVRLGLENHQGGRVRYSLSIYTDGRPVAAIRVSLRSGTRWTEEKRVSAGAKRVTVRLRSSTGIEAVTSTLARSNRARVRPQFGPAPLRTFPRLGRFPQSNRAGVSLPALGPSSLRALPRLGHFPGSP